MTPAMDDHPSSAEVLRQRAEKRLREAQGAQSADSLSLQEMRSMLHELQVHQIELEMQNEELHEVQTALDVSRARYFDLYSLAPVGYCSLSEAGFIVETNLAVASLLGVSRSFLVERLFTRFIVSEDTDTFHLYRQRLLETGQPQACELRMSKLDGQPFWVHLSARVAWCEDGAACVYLVLIDLSERKQAEIALRASESFGRSILDSVSAEIAVLDRSGTIVAVNAPWQRFAIENGSEPGKPAPGTGVGVNYLGVCRASVGSGASDEALATGEGIQAVIGGRLRKRKIKHAKPVAAAVAA
jgi:PAS domain S-box-containing protein